MAQADHIFGDVFGKLFFINIIQPCSIEESEEIYIKMYITRFASLCHVGRILIIHKNIFIHSLTLSENKNTIYKVTVFLF